MAILLNQACTIVSVDPGNDEAGADGGDDPADLVPASEWRELRVPPELHGQRLDRTLAVLLSEFSRSYLQQLIAQGAAEVHGVTVNKPSRKIQAGDALRIELRPTPMSQAFVPQAMDLDLLYEDEHVAVINKPAGLVVHPAPGNWSGTLLNGLLAHDGRAAQLPRAGIVHRLDKDTSGLMMVARSRLAMDGLVRQIAAREVRREYLALAHRPWQGPQQYEIDAPIGRDPRNRLRMTVVDLNRHAGKTALTRCQWLANTDNGCLLRCQLHTGRTHQIRVHLAHVGHPLVGDGVYGGKPAAGMARQALHARRLAFVHPVSGAELDFVAPLPADLAAALAQWQLTIPG